MSDLNSLDNAADDVSSSVPICVLEARSKVVGKLSEMVHQKSPCFEFVSTRVVTRLH